MNTMIVELAIYEALTEAGVKPETARRVERNLEAAFVRSQEFTRKEMTETLMTKGDGANLKADLQKSISDMQKSISDVQKSITDNNWKIVTFVVAANGLMLAFFKMIG